MLVPLTSCSCPQLGHLCCVDAVLSIVAAMIDVLSRGDKSVNPDAKRFRDLGDPMERRHVHTALPPRDQGDRRLAMETEPLAEITLRESPPVAEPPKVAAKIAHLFHPSRVRYSIGRPAAFALSIPRCIPGEIPKSA